MATIITIYSLLVVGLIASLMKNKEKTKKAFKIAGKAFLKTAPKCWLLLYKRRLPTATPLR